MAMLPSTWSLGPRHWLSSHLILFPFKKIKSKENHFQINSTENSLMADVNSKENYNNVMEHSCHPAGAS